MKKILVLQSRTTPHVIEQERGWYERAIAERAELTFASTVDLALGWDKPERILEGYDAVILGGSSDFDYNGGWEESNEKRVGAREIFVRLTPLVTYAISNQFPLFGVCLGHQMIAELYQGGVTHDHEQKKMGSYEVRVTEAGAHDPVLSNLPSLFLAQYAHKDSVTSLPQGATLLASGPACKFSILRYGGKAYTFQFHPEVTTAEIRSVADVARRYLPAGVSLESVLRESPEASKIIGLFVEKIVNQEPNLTAGEGRVVLNTTV